MDQEKITVKANLSANKKKVWEYYTNPIHITQWNFADHSWHCPSASNNLVVGGRYLARMEAKDGSMGFDFDAVYTEINPEESFTYVFGDRLATVQFKEFNEHTEIIVSFDPDTNHDIAFQKAGWQAILDNFKKYTETN